MNTGRRRHPIAVEAFTYTRDPDTGGTIEGWAAIGTEWASLDGISGREFNAAGAPQSVATNRVTIAYRDDLTTSHRFVYRDKKYDLKALLPNNDRTELVCMCQEGLLT